MVIISLILILFLLNIKKSSEISIQSVDPLYFLVQKGEEDTLVLIFNESVADDNFSIILVYDSDNSINQNYTFQRQLNPKIAKYKERAEFKILYNKFYPEELFGYYKLYYGNKEGTTIGTKILIYSTPINFKNPINRYYLVGDEAINCTFDFSEPIIREEINRISLDDGETVINNCSYYLEEKGNSLIISLDKSLTIKKYIFRVYPTYDNETTSPPNLNIYFQNFFIHYEAVYADASAESSLVTILVDFEKEVDSGFRFDLRYLGSEQVSFVNSGLSSNQHYNCYYNFTILNPRPGVINIIKDDQIRPIFLITYQTNSNKCYLSGTRESFEITFFKTSEMEYTHSVYFKANGIKSLASTNQNTNSPLYKIEIYNKLYQDTFYLYSRIPKLSSEDENIIDHYSLSLRIYDDPYLEDNTTTTLYLKIKQPQYLTFNITGAEYVNEIYLVRDNSKNEINLNLKECKRINENEYIYNCNLTNILTNSDETYIDDYTVEYLSNCDNKRLEIYDKKVIIKKGINLLKIEPNWVFIDKLKTTNVILTFSDNIDEEFNIIYCEKDEKDTSNCIKIDLTNGISTITHDLNNFPEKEQIYDVYLTINDQKVQNNKFTFKVIKHLDFIFNHQYFVKNNGADENYLLITKNFEEDNNNKIDIIKDEFNNDLTKLNDKNFTYNIYNLDYLGEITFTYFDKDVQEYIPIDKSIYVAGTIDELFSSYNNRECYYYKFKLTFAKRNYYNFDKSNTNIFLYINDKEIELDNQGNNEYVLKSDDENNIKTLIGNTNSYLYISEGKIDRQIYLYRSKFSLTIIGVPKYIIYPNNSLYFSNVTCDLCNDKNSIFYMSLTPENSNPYRTRLFFQNCIFSQNSMTINEVFFNHNYKYFQYSLDDENIIDINNQNILKTFHSKQLNNTQFTIDIDDKSNNTHLIIKITNTNKDFYCDLISNLTIYQIINGKNESLILDINSYSNEFKINDFVISFVIKKGNFDLDINHLTRSRDSWETKVDSSFYYYFGNVTSYKIFEVYPTVFVSHDFPKKDLIINITFNNDDLLNSFKKDLETICQNLKDINSTTVECTLSRETIHTSKNVSKSFSSYTFDIDLIYYNLSSPSKCVTLGQQENKLNLLIYVPDDYYNNKIYLKNNIYADMQYPQNGFANNIITIPIDVTIKDNIKYDIYIDNKLTESFNLKEFEINFIPKFEFEESGTIILLPEKGQIIKLKYFQNNQASLSYSDYKENINNISYFWIGNISKSTNIKNSDNENGIDVEFDLSSLSTSQNDYILSYIDSCGNQINTGINVRISSFYFERHYFVLKNNNNQPNQYLRIQGPINNQIELHMTNLLGGEDTRISTNENVYSYKLYKSGIFRFYYINNKVNKALNDLVYVVDRLDGLFIINTNWSECMFYNISKYLRFNFTFIPNRIDNSIFNMTLKIDGDNQNYSLDYIHNSNNKILDYILTYNNIRNRISKNQTLLIYFYENYDIEQPLYVFNYTYTDITLNSLYEDVIYSDAIYILFNMSCKIKIDNLENFDLYQSSNGNKKSIKCKDLIETRIDNVYNCTLYEDNTNNNPLMHNFNYDYYIMKYDNKDVSTKEFFISKDITLAEFNLEKEEEIHTNSYTRLKINSTKNEFYIPYLSYLNFTNISSGVKKYSTVSVTFNDKFNETNNYFQFSLYLKNKEDNYTLTQVCRKNYNYCRNGECKTIQYSDKYVVRPNLPDIFLIFNRRYISLKDSKYNDINNNTLIINFGGTDKDTLTHIIYQIYKTSAQEINENKTIDVSSSNNLIISGDDLKFGMYTFSIKSSIRDKIFSKNDYVFVVKKDNELLNLDYLNNNNCLYYDPNKQVLFTTLILNNSYIFRYNASEALNNLQINYGNEIFNYINGSYGYKQENQYSRIICGNELDFNIIENKDTKFVFTKLSSGKKCTSPDFHNGYYKDNIPLTEQKCDIKNIYLADKITPNSKSKLDCNFIETESLSYCNISRKFDRPFIDFDIYFNYGDNYLKLDREMIIYNSINDSDFDINYVEPRLSIISYNFDMNRISVVDINNKSYITKNQFISNSIDNVTFNYDLQNETSSYVTKLTRADYDKDREITIKHKDLYAQIKEIDCPKYQRPYKGECVECQFLARYGLISQDLKWIQDQKCVAKCDYDNFYSIFDSKNYYCEKCNDTTRLVDPDGGYRYVCNCLIGTVKSFEDQICYLPEDEEIAKLRNIQTRAQCYKASGGVHNYCSNHTTSCNVENKNGYLFPFCYCEEGYTGRYCEFQENNYSLATELDDVLSMDNNGIDETNIATIAKIRGITYFFEEEGNKKMEQFKSTTNIDIYIELSLNLIDKVKEGRNTVAQIFDVMELAIYFLKEKISNSRRLRNLEEENSYRKQLNKILNNLHYLNVKSNSNYNGNFKIQTDKLNLATFIVYKKNDLNDASFLEEMSDKNYFKIMEYANISETSLDDKIFVTLINSSLFDEGEKINSGDFGVKAYFSTTNDTNGTNTLIDKRNITFYISSSAIHFNFDLAEYYNTKNIRIYDKNDEAFTDPCFLSKDFDFDLTQKYRKNNVFQKITFGNDVCKYVHFEYEYNKYTRLIFECDNFSYFDNISELQYGMLEFNFKRDSIKDADKVYNLPTKCTSKIDNIGENWAFWFFLILCLLEIIYCIGLTILNLGSLKRESYRKGLIHDDFYQIIPFKKKLKANEDIMSNSEQLAKHYLKTPVKKPYPTYAKEEDNQTEVFSDIASERDLNKSFLNYLKDNFKELHPLASLCRVSLISPLILNSIFFLFNTLILFGFNALLYYESLIEKRIFKPYRDNFDYPMLKEFHKIILSILCQICLCAIAKLILIVTIRQKDNLKEELKKCKIPDKKYLDNNIVIKIDQFQDDMFLRRILSAAFMTVIIVFFFYYSVAFCGVYIKTQRNWFFSGIWSLFWNWVIFGPIYIAIISYLEYKKKDSNNATIYYLKRLFFF